MAWTHVPGLAGAFAVRDSLGDLLGTRTMCKLLNAVSPPSQDVTPVLLAIIGFLANLGMIHCFATSTLFC